MKLNETVKQIVLNEMIKNQSFSWYQGHEKSSGYIKTELNTGVRYGACRIYIKWESKKNPTQDKVIEKLKEHLESLLDNKQHSSNQKDFRHYITDRFFVDVQRLKHEAILSVVDALPALLKILEKSEEFTELQIQNLHNDLKNLECGVNDKEALEQFLEFQKSNCNS